MGSLAPKGDGGGWASRPHRSPTLSVTAITIAALDPFRALPSFTRELAPSRGGEVAHDAHRMRTSVE